MKQQSAQGVWDLGMRSAYARGGATMMPAVQLAMGPPGWCGSARQYLPSPNEVRHDSKDPSQACRYTEAASTVEPATQQASLQASNWGNGGTLVCTTVDCPTIEV